MRIPVGCLLCGFLLLAGAPASPVRASEPLNACGCYRDDQGTCKCTRKSKCGCPEECEPVGCEAKREKEADRAAEAHMKEIAARERKVAADAAKNAKAAAKNAKPSKKTAEEERVDRAAQEALEIGTGTKAPDSKSTGKVNAKMESGKAKHRSEPASANKSTP